MHFSGLERFQASETFKDVYLNEAFKKKKLRMCSYSFDGWISGEHNNLLAVEGSFNYRPSTAFSLSLYISSSLLGSIILFTGRFQRSSLYLYATPVHKFGSKPCTRFFANSVVRVEIMWLTTTLALSTSRGTIVGPWKQFGPFLVISVSHNNEVEAPVTDHLRDSLLDVDKNIRWCKLCPV